VADSVEAVTRLRKQYEAMEHAQVPHSLLFPWLPDWYKFNRLRSATGIYMTFAGLVDKRKKTGSTKNDALGALIEMGDSTMDIIQFIMGSLFAGYINTSNMIVWVLLYLAVNPEWKARVNSEVEAFLQTHVPHSANTPLSKRLSEVPIGVWEDGFPILEDVLRETMRMVHSSVVGIRRNMGVDLTVGGKEIPTGAFLVYPMGDTHANPAIYKDPQTFDPSRFAPGREEGKRMPLEFLGWGGGRHPCLGMRFAKLEIKLIAVLFMGCFEYHLVDGAGRKMDEVPAQDKNNIFQAKALTPVYLHYKRVAT